MSDETKKGHRQPHVRAQDHLKRILKTTALTGAAFTLGTACERPMVCDPLPAPICDKNPTTATFLNRGALQATALWTLGDGGTPYVSVELSLYGDGEKMVFKSDPALLRGKLLGVSRTDNKLTFSFAPDAGTGTADVGIGTVEAIIELDCATRPEALKLAFDVQYPSAGTKVLVTSLE